MNKLAVSPLTQDDFAPFGDVIEARGEPSFTINNGLADRFHALARVQMDDQGETVISLVHSRRQPLPHQVTVVERHPLASQAFIPCDDTPFVVVVGKAGESISPSGLQAFISNGAQGINYHAGTWHGLLLTPYAEMRFICVDRESATGNCEQRFFSDVQACFLDLD